MKFLLGRQEPSLRLRGLLGRLGWGGVGHCRCFRLRPPREREWCRVGMADCPATPLSEPDWRISHPALWTISQNAKLICEPEAAGRWCFNHWPSSEFRQPMNHAKPYASWTPKRALLCHTPRLLHAVLAAVPSLAPFRTKCRNRNRGRFCCRMAIARTRRRTCASSPLQLRIASWSQIRKYAPTLLCRC